MAVASHLLLALISYLTLFSTLINAEISASVNATSDSVDVSLTVGVPKGPVCKRPLGKQGRAKPSDPYWLEAIKHQGSAPYNPDPANYKVFRNVKDFGAVGDGVHDDTDAINQAIQEQNRCGENCQSSTLSPAVIYFPQGTYRVSAPIIPYYYSTLVGDPKNPPTLLADPSFNGSAVIDANPGYWINQKNFFRIIKHFVIDLRQVPAEWEATGIHWQVSQSTALRNIVVHMPTDPNTNHRGLFMENGSGGYMGDLVFNGGKNALLVGNQQFTVRNLTINNAQIGIFAIWNWGWTFQGLNIRNCGIGIEILSASIGAEAIIDARVVDTPTFIQSTTPSNGTLHGSLVLNNVKLENVPVAVGVDNGDVVLSGGSKTIASWAQGNVYRGENPKGEFIQSNLPYAHKASSLLDVSGRVVSRPQPTYETFTVDDFISVKDYGAKGDGVTDDTEALNKIFKQFADCKILFFDAGHYIVSDTVFIPAGTRMVGEAWTVIAGKGPRFQNQKKPRVVFQVGRPGDRGIVEISDIVFSTVGSAAGAVIVEWNVKEPVGEKGGAGMWDSHIRTGGVAGSQLEGPQCPRSGEGGIDNCFAAYLHLHITKHASAYLEATWVWLADHNLDGDGLSQISVYSGRGILSESQGPVWLIGTGSEHHAIYQYRFVDAKDHFMGLIQTESPYYQPTPAAPAPFILNTSPKYPDPKPYDVAAPSAWALSVERSKDIFIFGAGLYSFFVSYAGECAGTRNCQAQIANIDRRSSVYLFSLSTVASEKQISVNGKGIVDQADNINGFVSTVTYWSSP
ncbi:hypothetical protein MD484_g4260, partial [Candolleomyces efflorescens]